MEKSREELQAELDQIHSDIRNALSYVRSDHRERPFTDSDLCGEMVPIRLTGLCILAEIIQPGCRKAAINTFCDEMKEAAKTAKDPASVVAEDIFKELSRRRGVGHELSSLDEDIKKEILNAMRSAVEKQYGRRG